MTEDDEQRYRLPRSVIPSRYGLVLEPDLVAGSFVGNRGHRRGRARAGDRDRDERRRSRDRRVDRSRRETGSGSRSRRFGSTRTPSARHLVLGAEAHPGDWTLHIDFSGELNDKLRRLLPVDVRRPRRRHRGHRDHALRGRPTPAGRSPAGTSPTSRRCSASR